MDRTIRPLVIIAAFAASLVVGLVIMLWTMGGLRTVTARWLKRSSTFTRVGSVK